MIDDYYYKYYLLYVLVVVFRSLYKQRYHSKVQISYTGVNT
jgi:hypothetical protein